MFPVLGKFPNFFLIGRSDRSPSRLQFRPMRAWSCLGVFLALAATARAECIAFTAAANHVGETRCVTGKIYDVQQGLGGIHYLDFCEDHEKCPFVVVVFASDLRHVGDVRELKGKVIEVHGAVKLYDGRAEIILREARQLSGEAADIPPLPKGYDVEKKGRYSAGRFSYPSSPRRPARKRQTAPIPTEPPTDTGPAPE
jgi:hypothetical protein